MLHFEISDDRAELPKQHNRRGFSNALSPKDDSLSVFIDNGIEYLYCTEGRVEDHPFFLYKLFACVFDGLLRKNIFFERETCAEVKQYCIFIKRLCLPFLCLLLQCLQ